MKEIKTTYWSLISTLLWSWIIIFIPSIKQAIDIFFTKYNYNEDSIIIKRGIIHQEQLSIPFYRLVDIQSNQSIIGQLLKYGTITLFDKGKTITLKYVYNPDIIANDMRDMMIKEKKENGLQTIDLQ